MWARFFVLNLEISKWALLRIAYPYFREYFMLYKYKIADYKPTTTIVEQLDLRYTHAAI